MPRPLPNNPNVVKVAMLFTKDLRTFVNTLHFERSDGWDLTKMGDLAVAIANWWNTIYKLSATAEVALSQIQVRLLDPTAPLAVDYTSGLPVAGTAPGSSEAANVTQTISWRTGLAGKRHRGRIYVPDTPEGRVTADDRATSTQVTDLAAAAQSLLTTILPILVNLVVFHAPGDTPSPYDNTFDRVFSYVIENILDSQRRRLPGRGR